MFKTKDIYNKMCQKSSVVHKITQDERMKLQNHLKTMYKDIEAICDKHNLTIMLGGGCILGAMRNGGFIPWDDDMDLYMPRKDYELFFKDYYKELPNYYTTYSPLSPNGAIIGFGKIIDTRTRFICPGAEESETATGAFIDILPLENIKPGLFSNSIRRILTLFTIYMYGCVGLYELKSKTYKEIMYSSFSSKMNYLFRKTLGFVASIIDIQTWMKWQDKLSQYKHSTDWLIRPAGNYDWTPQPKSTYLPASRVKFEDIMVYGPNKPEEFLDINYGNWRKVPDVQDRWEHYVIEVYIPE